MDDFKRQFELFKTEVLSFIIANAPYRTGDLRRAIKLVEIDHGFKIEVDISYMVYTEEAWTYNSWWGKTLNNPNYKWFAKSIETVVWKFAQKLKGVVIHVN